MITEKQVLESFKKELKSCKLKIEEGSSEEHVVVSMEMLSLPVVHILSKAIGYQAFCLYTKGNRTFVEWQKNAWGDRYDELLDNKDVVGLKPFCI